MTFPPKTVLWFPRGLLENHNAIVLSPYKKVKCEIYLGLFDTDESNGKSYQARRVAWLSLYCCSVAKSYLTLSDSMDCSTPGFPVLHYLLEFTQIHVHWVSDAIQPSHPLLSPSLLAFSLSQHQGLFQWVDFTSGSQSIGASASVLPMNEYSRLISFRIGWFDILAVQVTLKSLF